MDFKSSYDEVPAELVHTAEKLNDTALALHQLAAASYLQALEMLKGAMARQTGDTSAETLCKEAKALLGELLSEPEEIHMLAADADSERAWLESLRRELAGEMMPALEQVDREWLEMRARDLARAMATFWWNLAPNDHQRRFSLGRRILDHEQIEQGHALASLSERFGLNVEDAHALLRAVQGLAATQWKNDWTTVSPEDYQINVVESGSR